MKKVAWIVTHPIQYYSPMYREISESNEIDLTVYYFSDFSVKGYVDKEFNKEIKWDIPLLDGYKYKFFKNFSWSKSHGKFFSYLNLELIKELKNNNYDLVIIHGWNTLSHMLAVMTCIVFGIPYALRGDTNALDINKASSFKRKVRNKLLKGLFYKASALFYIGEQNKKFYENFHVDADKLIHMPFAVDNDYFRSYQIDVDVERRVLGFKSNETVILFTGKLIAKKQLDLLLKSLENLSNYILLVVGEGNLGEELKKLAESLNINSRFLGFINQKDIPKFYWLADVYVMPSSTEPWGLAINEAMNCDCAIIASDRVGAADDLIKDNGYVFPYNNADVLKKNIEILLKDKELLTECKENSKKLIENYSFQHDLAALMEYFDIQKASI